MDSGSSDSSSIQRLRGLSDAQFNVMKKYPCVACRYFGFNIVSHYWECDLGTVPERMIGEFCPNFVRNVNLRDVHVLARFEHVR